jgi:hypothetical protein
MLELFDRAGTGVRREILFSAAHAKWAERGKLIARAFDAPDDGVLGAALLAVAANPDPKVLGNVLELAASTKQAQPPLMDALAAYGDGRARPHLVRWLEAEKSPVVRVKLLLALEHTTKGEADDVFLRVLKSDASAMVVEQCIGVVGRKRVTGADALLVSMALDATAPMQLRVAAIFAMGRFDTPEVRATLRRIDVEAGEVFKNAVDADGKSAYAESVDVARMMTALAMLRLGEAGATAKLQAAFDRGTGMSQLTALVMLAETGLDHPIIAQGLESTDTAILYGAARAAKSADARKYHDRLVALRRAPFVESLLASGLDSARFGEALDEAIAEGEKR